MRLFRFYWQPTPKKWRKIGDSLLIASTFANTFEIVREDHEIAIAILIVGVIGKFITNFMKCDHDKST